MSTRSSVRSRNGESNRLSNRTASDEQLAKGMFCAGCFALPLLWIANLWYFRHKIFDDQTSNILKRWLHLSLIGSSLAAIGLISWITYFQLTITSWDESFLVYRSPPLQNITNSTTPVIDQMLY